MQLLCPVQFSIDKARIKYHLTITVKYTNSSLIAVKNIRATYPTGLTEVEWLAPVVFPSNCSRICSNDGPMFV